MTESLESPAPVTSLPVDANGAHTPQYHEFTSEEITIFQTELLSWFAENQRSMPWRKPFVKSTAPEEQGQRAYEVWVSEIMLQQTQVATVIPYYTRFMEKWPTISDLARADIEDINKVWAGLGYYSRAKRLHEAAQLTVEKFNGILPNTAEELIKNIPGVGRYTAGAIASIVYGETAPVVDGNVIRVLTRIRAIGADTKSKKVLDMIWDLAEKIVDKEKPGDFNQALMELGATICSPVSPKCESCPVNQICRGFQELNMRNELRKEKILKSSSHESKRRKLIQYEEEERCALCPPWSKDEAEIIPYPRKSEKPPPKELHYVVGILEHENHFLMFKRPSKGLLAGLWEFPMVETESQESQNEDKANEHANEVVKNTLDNRFEPKTTPKYLGIVSHTFSHMKHHYHTFHSVLTTADSKNLELSDENTRWIKLDAFGNEAISTGMKKVVALVNQPTKQQKQSQPSNAPKITDFFKKK